MGHIKMQVQVQFI
uniref:Uncharacterized protein n=1 Tax=Anguilla anguilla TaxID=7936 RepID=A0A0E9TRB4_ANGAN